MKNLIYLFFATWLVMGFSNPKPTPSEEDPYGTPEVKALIQKYVRHDASFWYFDLTPEKAQELKIPDQVYNAYRNMFDQMNDAAKKALAEGRAVHFADETGSDTVFVSMEKPEIPVK